jgi:DNA polymerase I-like protein with 3'-5' exonuclease and polymerase domains
MIAANNSWAIVFDNLSGLPPWLSDALCRLSTGGGFGTRTLYENAEETLFDAMRPAILNGITDVATRPDLLDRAVVVELPEIPGEKRMDEKKLWEEFDEALPGILGGPFDAASVALRELPGIELASKPRMADVALWVTAAEGALGWEPGAFMEAYAGSREEINELALEGNPVSVAVLKLMEDRDEWIGTAGELLKELGKRVDDDVRHYKTWPKQPNHLSRQLKRIAPVLRTEGIEVEDLPRQGSERRKRLSKNKPEKDRHDRHDRHGNPEAHTNADSEGDGSDDNVTVGAEQDRRDRHGENPVEKPETVGGDGHDGGDDKMRAHSNGVLVTTPEDLGELTAKVSQANVVGLDIETYPQDDTNAALDPRRGQVRLLQVATQDVAAAVDVRQVDPTALLEVLREKTLVAHNGKFELSFLKSRFGYEHDGPMSDTQVLDAVIYYAAGPRLEKDGWKGFPKDKPHRRSLADVAADYLDIKLDKAAQSSDFGRDELSEEQVDYALKDAEILLPLKGAMMKRAEELGLERVVDLESRFAPALAYCEANGFALDTEGWREQALKAGEEAERAKEECDALAPPVSEGEDREGWNWASPKQLGTALELLGATMPKHPTGNYKTDDATLKGVTSPEAAARLVKSILRYRGAKKSSSTWGLGWFEPPKKKPRGNKFDKGHQTIVDGRVYSSFQQVVTTGRMSSSGPNLQNIPPELRKLFVAPPGRKLLIADYKQIELVTAAVVSREEKLLEAFRRGDDVHSLTSRGILESDPTREGRPVTEEEVRAFRPKAKMVSFGILYGITAKGLARRIENNFGVHISVEEAQGMIDRFLDTYPALKRWYLEECRKAERGDDVTHTLTGRRRLLDVSESYYGYWRANSSLRLNTPI